MKCVLEDLEKKNHFYFVVDSECCIIAQFELFGIVYELLVFAQNELHLIYSLVKHFGLIFFQSLRIVLIYDLLVAISFLEQLEFKES